MIDQLTRRSFLGAGVGAGVYATLGAAGVRALAAGAVDAGQQPPSPGRLVLNDDGDTSTNESTERN